MPVRALSAAITCWATVVRFIIGIEYGPKIERSYQLFDEANVTAMAFFQSKDKRLNATRCYKTKSQNYGLAGMSFFCSATGGATGTGAGMAAAGVGSYLSLSRFTSARGLCP